MEPEDGQLRLQEVSQEIVRHSTPNKTTTCCFYTSVFIRIKQTRYYMVISELLLQGGFGYLSTEPGSLQLFMLKQTKIFWQQRYIQCTDIRVVSILAFPKMSNQSFKFNSLLTNWSVFSNTALSAATSGQTLLSCTKMLKHKP